MAPPAMGEAIAALRRNEHAKLSLYEAMQELSAKKQRDDDERARLTLELDVLQEQTHQIDIEVRKAELRVAEQRGAATRPKRSMSQQVCESCEKRPATVHCAKCEVVLCDACDAQEHAGKLSRKHQRTPLGEGGAGAVDPEQALADATAQLRRANRAMDTCKRALAALAHPHFPELSTSALGRLVDCDLLVDRELARDYEIVGEPISAGQGKHTVVKARLLGAPAGAPEFCVLKQMPKSDLRALMNEVLVPHKLDHPLVQRVNCVFVEREGHSAYIETAYCPDGDLRQWLRGGPIPPADAGAAAAAPPAPPSVRDEHEVVGVMRLAFTALAYMHGQNVLHRDVKTSNILISDGKPMLCDFGIAKVLSGQTMTATVGSGLTTDFAPPEVLRAFNQGKALPNSRSSDMFSAGLVLYEAMYGEMAPQRMHSPYEVQLPLPPHSNPHVVPLLSKLLAPEPAVRPSAEVVLLEPLFSDVAHVTKEIAEQHIQSVFFASLAGTEPYPQQRLGFEVTAVRSVANAELARKFDACRDELKRRGRQGPELAEHWAFVGCRAAALEPICAHGLLPVGHALNPSRSTDEGWFGHPRYGVYLGTCGDYVLKYSNGLTPLPEDKSVDIIIFKVLPGKVYQCQGVEMGCRPKEGYDCHMSPHLLEWYLPLEGQSCPAFVLTIKAVKLVGDGAGDDA
jgi:serine/threonine protein kinase